MELPHIHTITQASVAFVKKLQMNGEHIRLNGIHRMNGARDRKVTTTEGIMYYLKFQKSQKWKNEWNEDRTTFRTINKKIADEVSFHYLVICDYNNRFYKIYKGEIYKYGKTRTQYGGEEVFNIPEERFEELK